MARSFPHLSLANMVPMPIGTRVMLWLTGPFILFAVAVGILSGGLSAAALPLAIATLPGIYSSVIPYGQGPMLYGVRAGMTLVSSICMVVVLCIEHRTLPIWLVVGAGIYAIWGLVAAGFEVFLMMKPDVRQRLYQWRIQRGRPTSTI